MITNSVVKKVNLASADQIAHRSVQIRRKIRFASTRHVEIRLSRARQIYCPLVVQKHNRVKLILNLQKDRGVILHIYMNVSRFMHLTS